MTTPDATYLVTVGQLCDALAEFDPALPVYISTQVDGTIVAWVVEMRPRLSDGANAVFIDADDPD